MSPIRLQLPAVLLTLCFLLGACTTSQETVQEISPVVANASEPRHNDVIAEVITKMPASDHQEQTWLCERLIETEPPGLRALLGYLTPPGLGDDTYARYAVSGLTKHVSRPGAEGERQMFEEVLLADLRSGRAKGVSIFLLHQLELIGTDRSISTVRQFLEEDDLYEPAAEVMVAIGSVSAVDALRQALSDAEDSSRQETFIKSLGDIQDESITDAVLPYASSQDWPVREAALYALARSGNPDALTTLSEASDTTGTSRQEDVLSYYVLYAERLAEEGHVARSSEIARQLLTADQPGHIKQAALSTLVQAEGEQTLETLAEFGTAADQRLRLSALSLAGELSGQGVSEAFVSKLEEVDPDVRADIISMLGTRGDASVLPSVTPYMEDDDPRTRLAAVEATATLNGAEALPLLIDALNRAEDSAEFRGIETLLRQMPTDELVHASAEALPSATDDAKVVLIRTLAERRATDHLSTVLAERASTDEAVRLEVYRALPTLATPSDLPVVVGFLSDVQSDEERSAVQDAVIAISSTIEAPEARDDAVRAMLSNATDDQTRNVLEVLPQVGGEVALDHLVEASESSNRAMQDIAIAALAEWPDQNAIPVLLEIASNAETSGQRSKLLEHYVRLAGTSEASNNEKMERIRNAAATAHSPEERTALINSLIHIDRPVALRAVGDHLDDPDEGVRERAHDVAVELLTPSIDPAWSSLPDVELLSAILEMNANSEIAHQFEEQLMEARSQISSGQPGPISNGIETAAPEELFNGHNLDGWEPVGGSSDSWGVSDGVLYTDGSGGGWLSTNEMYDNFVIELEYRVPEGGNSGVFLRAPREGNPAYQGMEIQILDDYADQYADLHAWQYTGSIYDVKAPSHRVSKPAGEWQTMKIVANGPVIQVVLNDEMILNTSLTHHMHLADNHPGLKRREGYIGLQNHTDRIEYRNIVIREIRQPTGP